VFHINSAITFVSQYSVMVMQCVFCEVGSDFLNINSVNLRLQNCNVIWDGVGRRMKRDVFCLWTNWSIKCMALCDNNFVISLVGPSNALCDCAYRIYCTSM